MPVMTSVTVCSTWMRGFISMKNHSLAVKVVQELDRAGVVVADLAGDADGGLAELAHDRFRHAIARGDLDHLLMAALHRAIALVQVEHVAVLVAEDLHFDVLGARDVFLQEHRRVAERPAGLGLRLVQQARQVGRLVDDAHAAAAAAERRLDDEREADAPRDLQAPPPGR